MTRTIRSGESYGVQNSKKLMFGLGDNEEIDSIAVIYSDGLTQSTGATKANSYVVFHSSGKMVKQLDHGMPLRDTICGDEKLTLLAPQGASFYRWNTSQSSRAVTAEVSGFYQVDMIYSDGATLRLPGVAIYKNVTFSKEILVSGDSVICHGETVRLSQADGLVVEWSTTEIAQELVVDKTGWYSGKKRHQCDEGGLDSVFIKVLPNTSTPIVMNDTLKRGEDAVLESSTPDTKWYSDSLSQNPVSIGPELIIENVQKDTQIYYAVYETYVPPTIHAGLMKTDNLYLHSDDLNATMIFDVLQPCTLHSVHTWSDVSGPRKVMLYDQNVTLRDSQIVDLDTGWNEVVLDFRLTPSSGRYRITTDNDYNMAQIGMRSPRLGSTKDVEYPQLGGEILRIIESQYGRDQFNYFFDWEIYLDSKTCEGERRRVDVVVEPPSASWSSTAEPVVDIFPNPSNGRFIVRSSTPLHELMVNNISGGVIQQCEYVTKRKITYDYHYDITPSGVYVIRWEGGQKRVVIVN
jgi:hypothetical protein